MAARDDTTAFKNKLGSGDGKARRAGFSSDPKFGGTTDAKHKTNGDWREPDLNAPGADDEADEEFRDPGAMSANLAEAEEPEDAPENGKIEGGKIESGPKAILKAKDLLESAKPVNEWNVAPSSVDFEDPLVRCLSLLAGLLQRPISAEALKAGLPHANEPFTPELAVRSAERAGLTSRVVRRPHLNRILPVTLPCILLLKGGSCCVLQNISRGHADVLLPEAGGTSKTLELQSLQEQYTGYAIFARTEAHFDERAPENKLVEPRA
ncbi:MAG: hypothetical protein RH942_10455 [Kiloniellaceae bacterium]